METSKETTTAAPNMDLMIYNSMTQQKELFTTIVPGKVVCSVTAYDLSHLGHARAAISFDILYRFWLLVLRPGSLLDQPYYDQDLFSYAFFSKFSCVQRNWSEHAGCFPSVNPPTLKSDMKASSGFRHSLHSRPLFPHLSEVDAPLPYSWVVAWPSCLDSRVGEHVPPTVVDRVSSTQALAGNGFMLLPEDWPRGWCTRGRAEYSRSCSPTARFCSSLLVFAEVHSATKCLLVMADNSSSK